MKYYSEITEKFYDDVEELKKEENESFKRDTEFLDSVREEIEKIGKDFVKKTGVPFIFNAVKVWPAVETDKEKDNSDKNEKTNYPDLSYLLKSILPF